MNVAILGASPKPDRFANKAQRMLVEHGHEVFPVSPTGIEILDVSGYQSVTEIESPIDTVTLYLGPTHLGQLIDEIIAARPKRVIFNPGTESVDARTAFNEAGIETLEACTLVMLRNGQF